MLNRRLLDVATTFNFLGNASGETGSQAPSCMSSSMLLGDSILLKIDIGKNHQIKRCSVLRSTELTQRHSRSAVNTLISPFRGI